MADEQAILRSDGQPFRKNAGIGLGLSIERVGSVVYLQITPTRPPANWAEAAMLEKSVLRLVCGKGLPMTAEIAAAAAAAMKQGAQDAAVYVAPSPEQEAGNGAERATESANCLQCGEAIPCSCMSQGNPER